MELCACGTELPDEAHFCWRCGRRQPQSDSDDLDEEDDDDLLFVQPRYTVLASIGAVIRYVGAFVLVAGIIVSLLAGLAVVASGNSDGGASPAAGVAVIIGGAAFSFICGLLLVAFADLVQLLIDVESNTRSAALDLASIEDTSPSRDEPA